MSYNMSKNQNYISTSSLYIVWLDMNDTSSWYKYKVICCKNILYKKKLQTQMMIWKKWGMHFLIITKEAYIDGNEENE